MSDTPPPPPGWHPDPTGKFEFRWWDGAQWTENVATNGVTQTSPLPTRPTGLDGFDDSLTVGKHDDPTKIQEQVHGTGYSGAGIQGETPGGGGTLMTEPVLVVNQKAKIIELNNQYGVFDQHGRQLASVNQVGQSTAKKALRLVASLDQYMTHKLEIADAAGNVVLRLTRPAKFIKSTVIVENAHGQEIGKIVQQNAIGKINFALEAGGQQLGFIKAQNWRAWNFRIENSAGAEVARITKTFEGLAKTMFTTADNYVVQITDGLADPLRTLVVASALSVDTALKQDSRGLG